MKKQLFTLTALGIGFIIGATALVAIASGIPGWNSATTTPPYGNVPAPINVSGGGENGTATYWQWKTGTLGLFSTVIKNLQVLTGEGTSTGITGKVLTALNDNGDVVWRTPSGGYEQYTFHCISASAGHNFEACFKLDQTTGNVSVKVATSWSSAAWSTEPAIDMNTLSFSSTGQAPYKSLMTIDPSPGNEFPILCIADNTGRTGCAVANSWSYNSWINFIAPF